jgi:hypothetical protein
MTTWLLSNGQELEKRKRQPYDPVKRRKVAENRGNACEKHRAAKTAVSCSWLCYLAPLTYKSVIRKSALRTSSMAKPKGPGVRVRPLPMTHQRTAASSKLCSTIAPLLHLYL